MKCLFVVPARIGSKGIKEKNIFPILGKPLITYTLDQINEIGQIENTVITTDSKKISDTVNKAYPNAGIDIRPHHLCNDNSSSDSVLYYIAKKYINKGFSHLIYLEPTFPIRRSNTILDILKILNTGFRSVYTVVEENSIIGTIENNKFKPLVQNEPRRRQDRKPKFKEVSSVYGLEITSFLDRKTIFDPGGKPFIIDKIQSQDINEKEDLQLAEYIINNK